MRDIAEKEQLRMCQRYRHLVAAGKAKVVVTTAIAREMVGFMWVIAHVITAEKTRSDPTTPMRKVGGRNTVGTLVALL